MARNNLTWIKGAITGDIFYGIFHLDSRDVQYLHLYLMIEGVVGSAAVKGLRVCDHSHSPSWCMDTPGKSSLLWVIGEQYIENTCDMREDIGQTVKKVKIVLPMSHNT